MGGTTHRTLDAFFFHKVGAGCRATALDYLPDCTPGAPLRECWRRIKWRLCVGMGCFLVRQHFTSAIFTSLYLPHFSIITFARGCTHCVLLVVRQFETQALPKSAMVFLVPCPVLAKETRDGAPPRSSA